MGGHVNETWTDEQSSVLIEMLADGRSYAEIAVALNEQFNTNYSRNAACGKGFRLRVTAPPKIKAPPRKRQRNQQRIQAVKPKPRIEEILLRCIEIEPRHLTLDQLESQDCRYPFGDNPFTFCGRHIMEGRSYCVEHFRLATTHNRSNSEAVTDARARHMRRVNFRKSLLEGA
jgi:GcrA cell cycle regulator